MSYVVNVTDKPKWYVNAWFNAFYTFGKTDTFARADGWGNAYPDYVWKWGGIDGPNTVTFPDEQSYIWFVLRWS